MDPLRRVGPALASLTLLLCALSGAAQPQAEPSPDKPMPDIPSLMHDVETRQRAAETIQKDYIYRNFIQFDNLDSHGAMKKSTSLEGEVFWINGVRVGRMLSKDGKNLTADETRKEEERVDKSVAKASARRDKADAQGKETDSRGHDEVTFSRMIELGTFSEPRRETVNGRPTIVVEYMGNPKAKTRSYDEGVFRELAGTVWVDEQDKVIQHIEGHFDHDFKIAGGMAVDVKKGTWFRATFAKINDEVWLPAATEADGHARYLVFLSLNGHFKGHTSDYRKFKATSTILPGVTTIDPSAVPGPPTTEDPGTPK
jgi:hypothetical protein